VDPSSLSVTNKFEFSGILKITSDKKSEDQFSFDYETRNFVFKTACRSQLLSKLYECIFLKLPSQLKRYGPFDAMRLRKGGTNAECKITIAAYGLVEYDSFGKLLQEYKFINTSRCGIDEKSSALFIEVNGRMKIFLSSTCLSILAGLKDQITALGLKKNSTIIFHNFNLSEEVTRRNEMNNITRSSVSEFDVSKITRRSARPVARQMHITEELVVEKDSSGFQNVSYHRIDSIYAIVRCWSSPRDFTIEYNNETSRTYSCAVRDTLLATLLDICHAMGNIKVIITGEMSDNLRLLPRNVDEDYHVTIKDNILGTSSIESWMISRLILSGKSSPSNRRTQVEMACKDLNANIPCPGVAPNTELQLVKSALTVVLVTLHAEVITALTDDMADNSRLIVTLLQTLYRIIPCVHGYKSFLEVREVDTRLLLMQLLKLDRDFVSYWTLEVMSVLCRCPLMPRSVQQEFVNKHTLLSDRMLKCLVDLMSSRLDPSDDTDTVSDSDSPSSEDPLPDEPPSPTGDLGPSNFAAPGGSTKGEGRTRMASVSATGTGVGAGSGTAPNPSPTAHLQMGSSPPQTGQHCTTTYPSSTESGPTKLQPFSSSSSATTTAPATGGWYNGPSVGPYGIGRERNMDGQESCFFPNSLVTVSAATLLESIVSSRRDTSSPELLDSFLDILSDRAEVLIHMLRSSSFLILENAAILMFILLKNRGKSAKMLKELALSECLTLKHFYNAVFSPSGTQRFISRFLVNAWLSGSSKNNPGKALLCRMIPAGLVEFLKHAPVSEDHDMALDEIEGEFYAAVSGVNSQNKGKDRGKGKEMRSEVVNVGMDVQARMRRRISTVSREKALTSQVCVAHARSGLTHDQQIELQAQLKLQGITPSHMQGQGQGQGQQSSSIYGDIGDGQTTPPLALIPSSSSPIGPPPPGPVFFSENFRIMFHMMTQNHQLPDLIWNERTRLELRMALDNEIKSFDKEQRLKGTQKVAWNFQQFEVSYDSLSNEMQVGSIYVRHLLEAGDSFLRSLENPSPVVLFEKLFRRVLVNINKNAQLSIVCTRALIRLYSVCWEAIGAFDDMLLIVKLLDEASNIELQHCLLDLLELLSAEESNLHQLLDKSFVGSMIKSASLAHLNPDQIGNVLARLTSNVLMLKAEQKATETAPTRALNDPKNDPKRPWSLWIPDDYACPRVWFVAPFEQSGLGSLPPVQLQRGPFRVSEIMDMLERSVILLFRIFSSFLFSLLPPLTSSVSSYSL
jgi:DNAJ protein RME-8 N-terminal